MITGLMLVLNVCCFQNDQLTADILVCDNGFFLEGFAVKPLQAQSSDLVKLKGS